ncbi:Uncharacterised protein [Dermacoccus nishinomiyaensis]|nr:Uncharacterised protein [Dermacoccus nishinomiyaensis]
MASAATKPNGSAHVDGKTARSIAEKKSFRSIHPGQVTLSPSR